MSRRSPFAASGSSTPTLARSRYLSASRPRTIGWQRGEVVDALYLADSEETAWAEWYRHLAERMIPPLAQMPRELWTWRVDLEVADLSTPDRLAAVGLPPPVPSRHSWDSFQRLGKRLWKEGWPGLLAPSAARPSGQILCLFRDEHGMQGAEPMPPPRGISEPPDALRERVRTGRGARGRAHCGDRRLPVGQGRRHRARRLARL